MFFFFFFSSRRRHTRSLCDWSSDVCSSDLWGQARDSLMVHAVHRERLGLEQPGQPRSRGDPHVMRALVAAAAADREVRSEEHTSELQSHSDLVCRLLLEKKKQIQ